MWFVSSPVKPKRLGIDRGVTGGRTSLGRAREEPIFGGKRGAILLVQKKIGDITCRAVQSKGSKRLRASRIPGFKPWERNCSLPVNVPSIGHKVRCNLPQVGRNINTTLFSDSWGTKRVRFYLHLAKPTPGRKADPVKPKGMGWLCPKTRRVVTFRYARKNPSLSPFAIAGMESNNLVERLAFQIVARTKAQLTPPDHLHGQARDAWKQALNLAKKTALAELGLDNRPWIILPEEVNLDHLKGVIAPCTIRIETPYEREVRLLSKVSE